jgi:hypothetical protein
MTNTWLDSDGLYHKFGTTKTTANTAGEYEFDGALHFMECTIDLTTLGATNGGNILSDVTELPSGVIVSEIQLLTETAATGSGAVLNLGLIRQDRTTELDFNGFVAALAVTAFATLGTKVVINVGSTGAGALLGTVLANAGLLVADYDTAAFTAGKLKVRIFYYKP